MMGNGGMSDGGGGRECDGRATVVMGRDRAPSWGATLLPSDPDGYIYIREPGGRPGKRLSLRTF